MWVREKDYMKDAGIRGILLLCVVRPPPRESSLPKTRVRLLHLQAFKLDTLVRLSRTAGSGTSYNPKDVCPLCEITSGTMFLKRFEPAQKDNKQNMYTHTCLLACAHTRSHDSRAFVYLRCFGHPLPEGRTLPIVQSPL